MFNSILIEPLYKLFIILLNYFKDAGITAIVFSLIVRIPITPLYFIAYKQENKLKKIQAKIKEQSKGIKDFIKQAEIASRVYKEEKFNPVKNLFLQLIPIPILLAIIAVFNILKKSSEGLIFLGLIDLKTPNAILAVIALVLQLLSLKNQPPETRKTAYFFIGIIGILLFSMPSIFVVYWIVILIWTILERKIFNWYEINFTVNSVGKNDANGS